MSARAELTTVNIRVSDLSEDVKHVEYRESGRLLNEAIERAAAAGCDQHFDEDPRVEADLYRYGGDVHVTGQVSGRLLCNCVRCLDQFRSPLQRKFRFLLVRAVDEPGLEADAGLDRYEGDEIDLGILVREQALLALEPLSLCRQDCCGLCPGCGGNLNHEACRC